MSNLANLDGLIKEAIKNFQERHANHPAWQNENAQQNYVIGWVKNSMPSINETWLARQIPHYAQEAVPVTGD